MNTPYEMNENEFRLLDSEDFDTLMAVLGTQALPLVEPAAVTLENLKSDAFTLKPDAVMGSKKTSPYLRKVGERFLKNWAKELRKAICENTELHKKERQTAINESHLLVGAIIGAIVALIPQLAALAGLLTVLGVMIAKSGIAAFCRTLS